MSFRAKSRCALPNPSSSAPSLLVYAGAPRGAAEAAPSPCEPPCFWYCDCAAGAGGRARGSGPACGSRPPNEATGVGCRADRSVPVTFGVTGCRTLWNAAPGDACGASSRCDGSEARVWDVKPSPLASGVVVPANAPMRCSILRDMACSWVANSARMESTRDRSDAGTTELRLGVEIKRTPFVDSRSRANATASRILALRSASVLIRAHACTQTVVRPMHRT